MKNQKLILAAVAILGMLAVAGALWLDSGRVEQEPVRVSFGYQPFGSNLAFFVAMEKGFFSKRGLEVVPVNIVSANDAASAIIRGEIAGDATIPLNVLLNIEENEPGLLKIFMWKASTREKWSDYLLVKKDSPIKSIADLRGKKVGGYPGTAQQTIIKLVLKQFMNESEIITVELPPNTQLAALDSGQVDALITYDEIAVTALEQNISDVLGENPIGKYIVNPYYGFPYVISEDFARKNPETARKIVEAMYEAIDYINANENEARQIMSKWVGTKPEIADKVNFWAQVKAEDTDREALQRLADIFYEQDVVNKKIDTNQLMLDS